jgi:hypothetical protein
MVANTELTRLEVEAQDIGPRDGLEHDVTLVDLRSSR